MSNSTNSLEVRMTVIEQSAINIEKSVDTMIVKHEETVNKLWKALLTVAILGAGAIAGVYVYSVDKADKTTREVSELSTTKADIVYHDNDVREKTLAARKTHDDLAREKEKVRQQQIDNVVKSIDGLAKEQKQLTRE